MGGRVYPDKNCFFYGEEDPDEFNYEGFFNDFSYHECVQKNLEAGLGQVVDPHPRVPGGRGGIFQAC